MSALLKMFQFLNEKKGEAYPNFMVDFYINRDISRIDEKAFQYHFSDIINALVYHNDIKGLAFLYDKVKGADASFKNILILASLRFANLDALKYFETLPKSEFQLSWVNLNYRRSDFLSALLRADTDEKVYNTFVYFVNIYKREYGEAEFKYWEELIDAFIVSKKLFSLILNYVAKKHDDVFETILRLLVKYINKDKSIYNNRSYLTPIYYLPQIKFALSLAKQQKVSVDKQITSILFAFPLPDEDRAFIDFCLFLKQENLVNSNVVQTLRGVLEEFEYMKIDDFDRYDAPIKLGAQVNFDFLKKEFPYL